MRIISDSEDINPDRIEESEELVIGVMNFGIWTFRNRTNVNKIESLSSVFGSFPMNYSRHTRLNSPVSMQIPIIHSQFQVYCSLIDLGIRFVYAERWKQNESSSRKFGKGFSHIISRG